MSKLIKEITSSVLGKETLARHPTSQLHRSPWEGRRHWTANIPVPKVLYIWSFIRWITNFWYLIVWFSTCPIS